MSLSALEPWHYFDAADQGDALDALRARMGATYATTPDDDQLLLVLRRSVEMLHRATDRFFVARTGSILLGGNGTPRLELPFPVASADQVDAGGITEIIVGDPDTEDAVDADLYAVNDGALPGPLDPRNNPFVEMVVPSAGGAVSRPPIWPGKAGTWPYGVNNIRLTGTWGYLEEDGSTPELILHFLARMCILNAPELDDGDGQEDKRRAAIQSESTQGRSYTLGSVALSAGLTLDRELDSILRSFRRPPRAIVSRAPKRGLRSRYWQG